MPVKIGERLVEQHHVGRCHQAARQRHALTLPAGEIRRPPFGIVFQPHGRQRLPYLLAIALAGDAAHFQRIPDIVGDVHMRPERIGLEHHRHVAPLRRQRICGSASRRSPRWIDPSVGCLEAGDHPQHRRLAAAGRPEQRQETAFADFERQRFDRGAAARAEILG